MKINVYSVLKTFIYKITQLILINNYVALINAEFINLKTIYLDYVQSVIKPAINVMGLIKIIVFLVKMVKVYYKMVHVLFVWKEIIMIMDFAYSVNFLVYLAYL